MISLFFQRNSTFLYAPVYTGLYFTIILSLLCEEREDQQDATIRRLLSTSVSTCFGHHYAHLRENKDRVLLHMVYCAGSAGCGW